MSYTVVSPNAIQLDLTQAELIWLLRFLKIPTLPGMLPGLAERPMTSDAEGGAMIMALQSLQIRGLVTARVDANNQEKIDLDSGVIGILGSAIRARQVIFVRHFTEGGLRLTNCYLLPEMTILHEQPQPFTHRFTTATDKAFVRDRLLAALRLPDVEALEIEEQVIGRQAMLVARTKLLRDTDAEAAARILTDAGWARPVAETFLTAVANMWANVLVTVMDIDEEGPRPRTEFELLVGNEAIFYLVGEDEIRVGSANPPTVMGSLLQATPALLG